MDGKMNKSGQTHEGMHGALMPLEIGALLLGSVLILISIPAIIIHLCAWVKDRNLLRTGTRVNGIITETLSYSDDDTLNSGQYRFMADFVDDAGITRCAKSRFAGRSRLKYMQQEVVIVYDPADPERSRFLVDISIIRDVVVYVCLFAGGIVLVLIGV